MVARIHGIEKEVKVFEAACVHFELLIGELRSRKASQMAHGEIEKLLSTMGMELERLLFQGYLHLEALREERSMEVQGPEGEILSRCREECKRDLMSIFGEVEVVRKGYSKRGVESVFPLDGKLNLPEGKYSHGLRLRVAEEVALNSFDEALSNVAKTTGGKVPKRQAEELSVAAALDFDDFYAGRASEGPEQTSSLLVMSTDGKGVVMRKEDLRPETRKAAEQAAQQAGSRLSSEEKKNRKRMATVATVYSVASQVRTPEMIMGTGDGENPQGPRCTNKRVWASIEHEPEEVIQCMFEEAHRRDPGKKRPWVLLVDGCEKQLNIILDAIRKYRVDVTLILDFIHVLQYLWKAANAFFGVGSTEAQEWVAQKALEVLRGDAVGVAAGIRKSATIHQLTSDKQKAVDKCAGYLVKYGPMVNYHEFLAEGLPIATGVIEGACRHLVKDRMDITGARWRLKSAEAVLRLRSLRSSGDSEAYWAFHQQQEHSRIYDKAA